ncbi:MAG: hypothetical protein AB4050_11265 [Synechococcus sp.]
MRYELPKSYTQRESTTPSPHSIPPKAQSRNSAAEYRPRPSQPISPLPLQSQLTPSASATAAVGAVTAQPSSKPSSNLRSDTNTAVSASTYQQLLSELQARNRENEHLKHVTQKLLKDFSDLQAKYAQVISSSPQNQHSKPRPLPQPNSGAVEAFETHVSHVTNLKRSPSSPSSLQSPSLQATPSSNRQLIGNALAKLSFLDRLRQPTSTNNGPPKAKQSITQMAAENSSSLPELRVLNRLRHAKKSTLDRAENAHLSEGVAATHHPSVSAPVTTNPAPSPNPSPEPSQTAPSQSRSQAINNAATSFSLPLSVVPPVAVDNNPSADYDYDSPYQKARQEQENATPLWMWLVAWLLLLPISAGLGYTFVQWVMNPGTPTNSPPPIEQAE